MSTPPSEPTNLIVGSATNESGVVGTYRADIFLGKGGDDEFEDDPSGSPAWGNDQLFGGAGDDTFYLSKGNDLAHGGDHRDYGAGRTAINGDGIDTVDYSGAAASDFMTIRTDVSGNATHSGTTDAAHRVLVTQAGADNGTDTLISIETIFGTDGVDVFEIDRFDAAQLAGSDGQGGLAEINFGMNDKPDVDGDLIDATRITQNLTIDVDSAAGFIQVTGDAEKMVKLVNAERAWGGSGIDRILGNEKANDLRGGAGADVLIGHGGDDRFVDEAGGDIIWGDAEGVRVSAAGDSSNDTVIYGASGGPVRISYSGGGLQVTRGADTDKLYAIETVVMEGSATTFSISGNIAAGTNLRIRDTTATGQIIDAARMNSTGITTTLSPDGRINTISDNTTTGTIQLEGFHTQIIATYGNDTIFDGSAEAKLIDAGRGNDYVNVAGTAASAVIFGGEGADQIIGSDAGDYIIDQEWGQAPSVQFRRDGTGLDPMAGSGSIASGAGDDTIIITRPQGALDGTSGLQNGYFVNPGTGNDWVKLSGSTGQLDYRYQRGDGLDVVQLHARSTLVYANAFEYAGELKQPYVEFDLRDYTSAQIAVTFETVRSRMVLEKLPNRDVLPVWELEGTITISLAGGGRIELRDAVLLARSSSYGTYGVAPTGTFDIDYLRQNTFISIVSPEETATATSVPFELITADNAAMSLTITAAAGNEAIKSAPASPAPAVVNTVPDGDQDVLLTPGTAAYFGGNGHDQLVVTWDLNALQSTLTDGVLNLSDKWGLITSTNLTAFDSVLVVSEDKVYSIADFHALLQTYGSEVQQIGSLGSDILDGLGGRNRLLGLAGDDRLTGQSGIDTLDGGPGKDKLAGFSGADILTGGAGADQFRYLFGTDSGTGAGADRITDFLSGTDRLNFALLDADPVAAGRQALSFIDTAAFSATGTAQVRYAASGADLLVQVDLDGNGTSDMKIVLAGAGAQVLTSGDFML